MGERANLSKRIDRLETSASGKGDVISICGPAGYELDRALAVLGITLRDRDLVIWMDRAFRDGEENLSPSLYWRRPRNAFD